MSKHFRKLPEKSLEFFKKVVPDWNVEFVQAGPKNYTVLKSYETFWEKIRGFEVRENDVWVVSLPRSGTTLTQEMVWQICNDLDFETGFKVPLIERYSFFEFPLYYDEGCIEEVRGNCVGDEKLALFEKVFTPEWDKPQISDQRRFIKSHWAFSLLPANFLTSGCKVVYIARNPKDQIVSRHNFHKNLGIPLPEKFEDFWTMLEMNLMTNLPYFEHIQEAWELRDQDNILFLFYEDILKDTPGTIRKIADFFNKEITDKQVDELTNHLQVENFKKNKSISEAYKEFFPNFQDFVRKGKTGTWKEELFTLELAKRADKWIRKHYEKTDLRFPYVN